MVRYRSVDSQENLLKYSLSYEQYTHTLKMDGAYLWCHSGNSMGHVFTLEMAYVG